MPIERNIACLESLWDDATENRRNVVPMLEIVSKLWSAKYSHLNCNTEAELEYNLKLIRRRNYGILYLAFHGTPGSIHLHDKSAVSFSKLADLMGEQFSGWVVHFGSCSTLRSKTQLADFAEKTSASLVTGYTKDVQWIESTAIELLLFEKFQQHQSLKIAWRNMERDYSDLVERTGLYAYNAT